MTYVKWTFIILFWLIVGAVFHYTLPQTDIVRITDTYEKRIDPGENRWFWAQADVGSDGTVPNRDVLFIQTTKANGDPMVYRNEDTGWGWPPYFKFDTANLYAEAGDLRSTSENPKWVALKHYGWRNEFFTIFPNAISVRQVNGPDVTIIPWLNIAIIVTFLAIVWAIWVRLRRFRRNRIDPVLDRVEDSFDAAGDSIADTRGRFRQWMGTWTR